MYFLFKKNVNEILRYSTVFADVTHILSASFVPHLTAGGARVEIHDVIVATHRRKHVKATRAVCIAGVLQRAF